MLIRPPSGEKVLWQEMSRHELLAALETAGRNCPGRLRRAARTALPPGRRHQHPLPSGNPCRGRD
jgi:hypothetical protein